MARLSETPRRILEFVRSYIQEHGYPPSVRDIQKGCGLSSPSVVHYNLQLLQREGLIRRTPEVARGIDLAGEQGPRTVPVPLLGTIAAGQPLPVFGDTEAEGTLEVPTSLTGRKRRLYALRVRGQSMVDAYIDDGDIVLVEPTPQVRDGEMVVAWLKEEKEATLKRLYREGDRVRLQPANPTMAPIYRPAGEVEVQGRVVGVLRFYR